MRRCKVTANAFDESLPSTSQQLPDLIQHQSVSATMEPKARKGNEDAFMMSYFTLPVLLKTLLGTILLLFARKIYMGCQAVHYVNHCWDTYTIDAFRSNDNFQDFIADLRSTNNSSPPAIFILNQYALQMTYNFLCNTQHLHDVHKRAIFVTLDDVARDRLNTYWPQVRTFHWPNRCFQNKFGFGQPAYQALYTLRANLAAALAEEGVDFWMMQQDTFWRESLFDSQLEKQGDYDILFDQVGAEESSLRAGWINGANFFVRASSDTAEYFRRVAESLSMFYAPDMGIMIYQCLLTMKDTTNLVNCWEWLDGDRTNPPYLMQLDCETDGGTKMEAMRRMGFYFLEDNSPICNRTSVERARESVRLGTVPWKKKSWARWNFTLLWIVAETALRIPLIGALTKPLLPAFGFYAMLGI